MVDIDQVWNTSLNLLKDQIHDFVYVSFVKNLQPISLVNGTLYLLSPNEGVMDFIKSQYSSLIKNSLNYSDSSITDAIFVLDPKDVPDYKEDEPEPEPELESYPLNPQFSQLNNSGKKSNMNPKYTFDKFVIGESNRFAHAACVAVAENPATEYNPLFIYGGVGLGKTHLMQAIGNYCIDEDIKDRKIVYISCEDFTNEFINSIQTNTNNKFREKFRSIDILLIDDIQFLAGKIETQEAFFHTFNALYEANKQIVITSDRPPKEIKKLEERLRSRFEMGLITDISTPSFETCLAILRRKAHDCNLDIPEDVMEYIAENFNSNIRELEGALTTLKAYANLSGEDVTLDLTKKALKDLLDNEIQIIDVPFIKKVTAKYFNIMPEEMDSKKRTKKIALPRQVAMYLSRELTDDSFPKIGEQFGGRDHTTVLHACKKISKDMVDQREFANLVETIKQEIVNSSQ